MVNAIPTTTYDQLTRESWLQQSTTASKTSDEYPRNRCSSTLRQRVLALLYISDNDSSSETQWLAGVTASDPHIEYKTLMAS